MQYLRNLKGWAAAVCGVAVLAAAAPAVAQRAGYSGGGHYGGAHYGGGYYGGGYRGAYYGGYRGYYGYGGWGGWGYYPWVWAGVGLGLYAATVPYAYPAPWYGGVTYTYPANPAVQADPSAVQYSINTAPPSGRYSTQRPAPAELMVYPKNGQSADQQTADRYECYRWAVSQLGYDPTTAGGGTVRGDLGDYNRAQTACLEARGYSVK